MSADISIASCSRAKCRREAGDAHLTSPAMTLQKRFPGRGAALMPVFRHPEVAAKAALEGCGRVSWAVALRGSLRSHLVTPLPGGFGHRPTGTMTGPRGARCTGAGEGRPVCTR